VNCGLPFESNAGAYPALVIAGLPFESNAGDYPGPGAIGFKSIVLGLLVQDGLLPIVHALPW
jgi:hypothetical protein